MMPVSSTELLTRFQLQPPQGYGHSALDRLAAIRHHSLRKAAVLIGITQRPEGATILLTKRSPHLIHHPGQISFPGGKVETSDSSLVMTAIRETGEEIGLAADSITVIGQLPEIITISGFCVTPVVATIANGFRTQINPGEVSELIEVPAGYLLRAEHLHTITTRLRGHPHRIYAIPYERHFIWGMTGQIIAALQQQLAL